MAEGTIQLPPDSTGTVLRTITNPAVAAGAHQEVMTLAGDDGTLVGADGSNGLRTREVYGVDESLPAQDGAGAVLTFTFAQEMDIIWVRSQGGTSFAKITGDPANDDGMYCEDGVPLVAQRRTDTIKVWAPVGARVYVWGFG